MLWVQRLGLLFWALLNGILAQARQINPDDIAAVQTLLSQNRNSVSQLKNPEEKAQKYLELGLWKQANTLILTLKNNNSGKLLRAEWLFLNNHFTNSSLLVDSVLENNHSNISALCLKSQLALQAWRLKSAEEILLETILKNPKIAFPQYLLGKVYLKGGKFREFAQVISKMKAEFSDQSYTDLLDGQYFLIKNLNFKADSTFKIGLSKTPLNADLRYYYGYTQWKNATGNYMERVEKQWDICLQINPLHFLAIWHLGHDLSLNTPVSTIQDSLAIKELTGFDPLIGQKKYTEAVHLAENILKKYPTSLTPLIFKASALYLNKENARSYTLDSAQSVYLQILKLNPHYFPAERGLATTILAQRRPFLYFYDSLQSRIQEVRPQDLTDLQSIIPQSEYLPPFFIKMAKMELFTAWAYFALLKKGEVLFQIIPLHHWLSPPFNGASNSNGNLLNFNYWKSNQAGNNERIGLEDLENGAYFEGNILLYNCIRLIHSNLFTDMEKRKIRLLYLSAMKSGKILEYFDAPDEWEYLSQIYSAYFSGKSVDPQDLNSSNTHFSLKIIDPAAYHFIDSLIKVETQFSLGNQNVFKDQWAEIYMGLSEKTNRLTQAGKEKAKLYLDSAGNWDRDYLPLLITKADLAIKMGDQSLAERILKRAEELNPQYSITYEKDYELNKSLEEAGLLDYASAFDLEKSYLLKAIHVETDPVIQSDLREKLVNLYRSNSLIPEQILSLDELMNHIVDISNPEKERKNLTLAQKSLLSLEMGYFESLEPLKKIYELNQQSFNFNLKYAQCLYLTSNSSLAIAVLEKSIASHKGSEKIYPEEGLYLALYLAETGNIARSKEVLRFFVQNARDSSILGIKIQLALRQTEMAESMLRALPFPHDYYSKSQYFEIQGDLRVQQNKIEEAISSYQDALANNPYNFKTAKKLWQLLKKTNRSNLMNSLLSRLNSLAIKPGPLLGLEGK